MTNIKAKVKAICQPYIDAETEAIKQFNEKAKVSLIDAIQWNLESLAYKRVLANEARSFIDATRNGDFTSDNAMLGHWLKFIAERRKSFSPYIAGNGIWAIVSQAEMQARWDMMKDDILSPSLYSQIEEMAKAEVQK